MLPCLALGIYGCLPLRNLTVLSVRCQCIVSVLPVCFQHLASLLVDYCQDWLQTGNKNQLKTSVWPVWCQIWQQAEHTLASHWLHTKAVKKCVFLCIYKVYELKSSPKWKKKQANFWKTLATNLTTHWLYTDNNLAIKKVWRYTGNTLAMSWFWEN